MRECRRVRLFSARLLVALVSAPAACTNSWELPRAGGGSCRVEEGTPRRRVRERCGPPCGEGVIPKGGCADGCDDFICLCSQDCDVYGRFAVCYLDYEVEFVEGLPARGVVAARCTWGHDTRKERDR